MSHRNGQRKVGDIKNVPTEEAISTFSDEDMESEYRAVSQPRQQKVTQADAEYLALLAEQTVAVCRKQTAANEAGSIDLSQLKDGAAIARLMVTAYPKAVKILAKTGHGHALALPGTEFEGRNLHFDSLEALQENENVMRRALKQHEYAEKFPFVGDLLGAMLASKAAYIGMPREQVPAARTRLRTLLDEAGSVFRGTTAFTAEDVSNAVNERKIAWGKSILDLVRERLNWGTPSERALAMAESTAEVEERIRKALDDVAQWLWAKYSKKN